jgi:hypothetical protein
MLRERRGSQCQIGLGQKYPQYSPKENGPNNKMNAFNVLLIVMILVYGPFDISWQELGRPIFLEGVFGLTHFFRHCRLFINNFKVTKEFVDSCYSECATESSSLLCPSYGH